MNKDELSYNIEYTEDNKITIVYLKGELNGYTINIFRNICEKIKISDSRLIIFDFKEVTHVISMVFGVLINYCQECNTQKKDLNIVNLSEHVYRIFDILGGNQVFKIYKNKEKAIEFYNNSS